MVRNLQNGQVVKFKNSEYGLLVNETFLLTNKVSSSIHLKFNTFCKLGNYSANGVNLDIDTDNYNIVAVYPISRGKYILPYHYEDLVPIWIAKKTTTQ